ncbi:MAG: YkvA family protein [Acidobacteriota bacterium]
MAKRREMKKLMRDYLLFIPNLMRLLLKLLRDDRVSNADKAILAGTIIYVIAPIDVIPDFIPFIGLVDDSYLIAISVMRLLNRADREVVMEHWKGEVDIKELVTSIARIAEFFLPQRLKNVLHGRIDPRPKLTAVPERPAVNE